MPLFPLNPRQISLILQSKHKKERIKRTLWFPFPTKEKICYYGWVRIARVLSVVLNMFREVRKQ